MKFQPLALIAVLALAACGDDQQANTPSAPGEDATQTTAADGKQATEASGPVQVALVPLPPVAPVHECDQLAADIHDPGRVTQGVTIFRPAPGDAVASIACVSELEIGDTGEAQPNETSSDGGSNGQMPLEGLT